MCLTGRIFETGFGAKLINRDGLDQSWLDNILQRDMTMILSASYTKPAISRTNTL